MRRWLPYALGLVVVAVVVIGLVQASGDAPGRDDAPAFDLQAARAQLEGSPPALAALHAEAAELVSADPEAFEAVVKGLRGTPVVINLWGSWCTPCRREFPILQQVGTRFGKQVAFLGINGMDPQGPAREYLTTTPLPYPSYVDRGGFAFAKAVGASVTGYPTTIFIDRQGEVAFLKAGEYQTEADLVADLERYLDV